MKMTIEVDSTPEEARRFMGLPDVTVLNEQIVREMQERMTANISMLSTEEMMKNWMTLGAGAQEQFRKLMEASLGSIPR